MANTARHYSREPPASTLADQLSLSANEHTALPAADEHTELIWHDSPTVLNNVNNKTVIKRFVDIGCACSFLQCCDTVRSATRRTSSL